MKLISEPSALQGEIEVPASKSHTIRALLMAMLSSGRSQISNPLDSADTRACVGACVALGAEIQLGADWHVRGVAGRPEAPKTPIDVANSGTTLYLGLGAATLASEWVEFTGDEQIRKRPAGPLLESLRDLGAQVESADGLPPLRVKGPLRGGKTAIACPTSQYLSSLLIACPLAAHESQIRVTELNERPYVQMTLEWLNDQSIDYSHENMERFWVPGGQSYEGFRTRIPGDFSSAAFFLCAGAIAEGEITLHGLNMNDAQGDKKVVYMLREMGARVTATPKAITVKGGPIDGREFDLNATPDALPAMAVVGCFAKGETRLLNVPQARIKETDRIAVMAEAINALGGRAEELPDGLVVHGMGLKGGEARGHGDHRVVMALAVAGLAAAEPVTVDTAESTAVTFPDFVELMQSLGARMRRAEEA